MSWLSRLVTTLRSRKLDDELDEELRFHLEARAEELVESGLSPEEASQEARRRLGGRLGLRESSREIKLIPWLDSIARDVRFGLRVLRKDALVTWAAIVSLSLAIGACTAAFSLIEALILRPLPVAEPERLVYLSYPSPTADGPVPESVSFSYPFFERLREAGRPYVDLFGMSYAFRQTAVLDGSGGQEDRLRVQWVSGDAFALLGVRPALGRLLGAADDQRPGEHPGGRAQPCLLEPAIRRQPIGRRPLAHARREAVSDRGYRPGGAGRHRAGIHDGPLGPEHDVAPGGADGAGVAVVPRLGSVEARCDHRTGPTGPATDLRRAPPGTGPDVSVRRAACVRGALPHTTAARIHRGRSSCSRSEEGPFTAERRFSGVCGLLLLIACANVANLLVARAARRQREMALRISIGAGRARIVQQVLIESALLAAAACVIGALFAVVAAPLIVNRLTPTNDPAYLDLHLNGAVFAFLAGLCALSTVLFGTVPALRASAVSPNDALKADGARHSAGRGVLRPLVAAQVGFSFVVLFVAGLLLLSFYKLARQDPGFAKDGLAIFEVEMMGRRPGERTPLRIWREVREAARRLPGVPSASLSGWALFSGSGWTNGIRVPGRDVDALEPHYLAVSPGFFDTMGVRLVDGRDFQPRDAEPLIPTAVVVNETFAGRYFPGESPLGRHFSRVDRDGKLDDQEIVGLARDARYRNLREPAPPTVYVPHRDDRGAAIELRTAVDPTALAAALRPEMARVAPALRIDDVTTQATLVDDTIVQERLLALLSSFFAVVALVLAAVGLYGVLSYAVARRTREIGIRLALGARSSAVVRLVVGEVALLVAAGLAAGAASGLVLARFLASLLFEVRPSDFWNLALPLAWLLLASVLAALPAAVRAVRVDPTVALRYE